MLNEKLAAKFLPSFIKKGKNLLIVLILNTKKQRLLYQ